MSTKSNGDSQQSTVIKQCLKSKAYHYLSFRPRTESEMMRHLREKLEQCGGEATHMESVMTELKSAGLINDGLFIKLYVESRTHSKPRGEFLLRGELLRLGIQQSLIDEYFEQNLTDEHQLAKDALSKKWSTYIDLKPFIRRQKAHTYLYSKGFSPEVISKAIEEFEGEE